MSALRGCACLLLLLLAFGCSQTAARTTPAARSASATAKSDVELLLRELERIHPNPYHATPRRAFRAAADGVIAKLPRLEANELLVELMRLVALLGERDGHAALSPLASGHRREMHLYPIWLYSFPEGTYVVAAAERALEGLKLVAVAGRPLAEVQRLVEPLTPHDNAWSLRSRLVLPLVTAEVLHGLGVTDTTRRATFTFETRTGERRDVQLEPLAASQYTAALRHRYPSFINGLPKRSRPLFVSRREIQQWLTTLRNGSTVYLAYNLTMGSTHTTAQRLLKLARGPKVRRIIVDLRNNPGGEISTYGPLLEALREATAQRPRRRLVVLTSRATFSAAVHFAADVKRTTRATFLGEPTGGAPNHYSDTDPVLLPTTGWQIGIPRARYVKLPGRSGLTLPPTRRIDTPPPTSSPARTPCSPPRSRSASRVGGSA